jgi:hypothetical protein
MAATRKGEVIALNALFGVTRYIGAFTTATNNAGGGTEASGGSYARATLLAMTVTEGTSNPSEATNGADVLWPEATASWGTITHVGVYTAASGGDMIAHAALTEAKAIGVGDVLRFLAGQLKFTAD